MSRPLGVSVRVAARLMAAAGIGLLAGAGGAFAASPVVPAPIHVQVWPEEVPGGAVVIIATELDESVELPVTVRLPLPEGLNVDWAGEISPSDPASDVARPFTVKEAAGGGRYVEFEVSEYAEAQIDLSSVPLEQDGESTRVTLSFVQSAPASETGFSVRIPPGAELVDSSPEVSGKPSTNEAGESLYALESQSLKPGATLDLRIEYRRKAPVTPASRANALVIGLAAAVIVVVIALVIVVVRQRQRGAYSDEE